MEPVTAVDIALEAMDMSREAVTDIARDMVVRFNQTKILLSMNLHRKYRNPIAVLACVANRTNFCQRRYLDCVDSSRVYIYLFI